MELLSIVLDVLAVLAIICFGAFIVILLADMILSSFDKHEGVFFNKNKKQQNLGKQKIVIKSGASPSIVAEESAEVSKIEPITEITKIEGESVVPVDYKKAAEEQRILQNRNAFIDAVNEEINAETIIKEEVEENIDEIIAEVAKIALKEMETSAKKEEVKEEPKEKIKKAETIEEIKEELFEEILNEVSNKIKEEVKEEPKIEDKKEDKKLKKAQDDLKRMREDVFALRRAAFKDLQEAKSVTTTKTEVEYVEEPVKYDVNEINKLKLKSTEIDLVRKEIDQLKKEKEGLMNIKAEKEKLEKELISIRNLNNQMLTSKPYFTKDYYKKRLNTLTEELKEAEKDLRLNKREYIPLKRVKKTYNTDVEKLRRKEALVAKQKIALYGVNNANKVSAEKKAKLEQEVETLNELKDSVFACEQVIKQNKDRYPVLEKANKLLTKNVERLQIEIQAVENALAWYADNE